MATMDGLAQYKKPGLTPTSLAAFALAAPLLMSGCSRLVENDYRVAPGQKDIALALTGDAHKITFFEMKQGVNLTLTSPPGTLFAINKSNKYGMPLDVGQRQNVYFDVVSDGSDPKMSKEPKRIDVDIEGYERPGRKEQEFETRVWSKSINNKPHTPTLLSVQYRYAMGAAKTMGLNLGNFRHDPKSQFFVQGKQLSPVLVLQAPPGEKFVFAPKGVDFDRGDQAPVGTISAREYRIQLKPGQETTFNFWLAGQNERVRPQSISVQYTPTL